MESKEGEFQHLIAICISVIVINLIIVLGDIILNKFVFSIIMKYDEKRRKKKYSLYNWVGELGQDIYLYEELNKVKEITNNSIKQNFDSIKFLLKEKYPNKKELNEYKIILEAREKSEHVKTLKGVAQAFLIAGSSPLLINVTTGDIDNVINLLRNLFVFVITWFGFLFIIRDLNHQMDRNILLLKLVNICLEEYDRDRTA